MDFSYRRPAMAMLVLMLVLYAGNVWAEAVTVRSADHQGYGRIVFNWLTPVGFTAAINGNRLVVNFSRPIETSYGGVVRKLKKYLRDARPGANGRSVTFLLKKKFTLRKFNMGAAVVVDLMDKVPSASPKPSPKSTFKTTAGKTAGKSPVLSVGVRSGAHKGYSRIVFDWPKRVAYKFKRTAGGATITFAKAARIRLGSLRKRPPKYVTGIKSNISGNTASVTMMLPKTSKVRHSYSGPKVVIDVIAPSPGKVRKSTITPPAAVVGKAVRKNKPGGVAKGVEAAKKPLLTTTSTTVSAPPGALASPTALAPPRALVPPTAAKKGAAGTSSSATPLSGAVLVPTVSTAPLKGVAGGVSMRFGWNKPVGAAVFRRAGFLWVVFDKPSKVDVKKLRASGGNLFRSIEQIPSKDATDIKMETVAGINPGLKRDGLAWILEFRKRPLQARIPIKPKVQPNSPVGARVFIPVNQPGKAVVLNDKDVGDSIIVVPVPALGYGVFRNYRYPQFDILMSAQGVVIHSKIDGLRVRTLRQGIEIISAAGLKLSSPGINIVATAGLGAMQPLTRVFKPKEWKRGDLSTFNSTKQKLLRNVIATKANSPGREKARMDLARFYFSNGFDPEALGVLSLVRESDQGKLSNPEFRAMRGMSNFFMGRLKDAKVDLFDASLNSNTEGLFLRSALLAADGDIARSTRGLRRAGAIMRKYPKALKMPLSMLIAKTAIAVGDIKQAGRYIKEMKSENPSPARKGQIDYVEGKLKELEGDFKGALGKWEDAMAGPRGPGRAKAAFARAELLLKLRDITPADAINKLEKLRFTWRGGDFEFNLLRRLGKLYIEEGDFRNGLRTLRQAVTNFPNHEKVDEVSKKMSDVFNELYLGGKADSLAPVTAIALYDEFKELTPPGAKGDEMIRKLADRLVSIDLLDRGAKLLENQIKFRLGGEEKARVGAQLALVRILAREPEKALAALKDSDVKGISAKLSDQRRHLKARIMMDLNRNEDALKLLDGDKSMDAKLLREELYWDTKDWPHAAQELSRLTKDFNAVPKKPLGDKQSKLILNLAVALTLSGNNRGLERIRRDYGAAMENTPLRDAFRLISSPDSTGLIGAGSIAGKVKDVEKFQTFLANFREQLSAGGLSSIN